PGGDDEDQGDGGVLLWLAFQLPPGEETGDAAAASGSEGAEGSQPHDRRGQQDQPDGGHRGKVVEDASRPSGAEPVEPRHLLQAHGAAATDREQGGEGPSGPARAATVE